MPFSARVIAEIGAVRADRGAAGFAHRRAGPAARAAAKLVFGGERRHLVEPALDRAVECQTGARKRRLRPRRRRGRAARTASRLPAATATPCAAMTSSSAASQAGSADLFDQCRRAAGAHARAEPAHRRATRAACAGSRAEHEPVEKPPPAAGPFDEQAIHLRRQPDDPEALAERRLAARRLAVDAHDPALAFHPVPAGADLQRAAPGRDRRGDGPAADRPGRRRCLPSGPAAIDVAEPGAAQPAPRRQKGQRPRADWSCRRRSGRSAPPVRCRGSSLASR